MAKQKTDNNQPQAPRRMRSLITPNLAIPLSTFGGVAYLGGEYFVRYTNGGMMTIEKEDYEWIREYLTRENEEAED